MRLAIVGCGDAAATTGLASRFVSGVRVCACVDLVADRARSFAGRFRGARSATDWRTLVDAADVDAVYLAVPHSLHAEMTLALAEAGKAVLLEKPLAHSVESAQHLLARLPAGHRVGVNYQYRYDPKAWALVQAASEGRLGDLCYITVDQPWYRGPEYFSKAPWHANLDASGGGTLLTQGSHALDIALLCTASKPVAAIGRTYRRQFTKSEVEDLAVGQVETTSGVPVFVTSSMVSPPGFRASVRVYGTRGAAVYRGPVRASLHGYGVHLSSPAVLTRLAGYRLSLAGFRRWVELGTSYRCPAEDALSVLRAVHGIYESATTGHAVVIGET